MSLLTQGRLDHRTHHTHNTHRTHYTDRNQHTHHARHVHHTAMITTQVGEKAAHYFEFIFEMISSAIAFWFCMDNRLREPCGI